jgi:Zn-dependent peptidase ImmA (M78 family)/transcriptional regulator with XRE-family HTH domain
MIGHRIRQARVAAGLSMDESVLRLAHYGTVLTKAALSKYELGRTMPKASLLQVLGKAFQVTPDFFLNEDETSIVWYAYRRRVSLRVKAQERIKATAEKHVETFLWLRRALNTERPKPFPDRMPVATPEDAEFAARQLRAAWGLGEHPLESLIDTLEDCDGIVVDLPDEHDSFDGLAGIANQTHPVLVSRRNVAKDRKRFTMAHELGHLAMDTSGVATVKEEERLADRFAAAFLVPAHVAYKELGRKRTRVSFDELILLKEKYGFSVQAWLYRARTLGIIDEGHFNTLFVQLSALGLRKQEFGTYTAREAPARFERMVRRALSEGLIDKAQAIRWCPGIRDSVSVLPMAAPLPCTQGPRALFALSGRQRELLLQEAAEAAEDIYRTGSPALIEDVIDDHEEAPHAR